MQNDHVTQVIVLDDDPINRFAMKRVLRKCECEVHEFDSVAAVLSFLDQHQVDFIFSDVRLPNAHGGEELLNIVNERKLGVPLIMMSSSMDNEMNSHFMAKGAVACLQKPLLRETCETLLKHIRKSLKNPTSTSGPI